MALTPYMLQRQQLILNGRPLHKKEQKPIPKVSEKRKAKEKELKAVKKDLDQWFDEIAAKHLVEGLCNCMECGEVITAEYIRHATAHLLPKKLFKSVDTHELNYLILGAGCGCHDKTHRVDKFIKMKIWPVAAKRIKVMMPLLPMDELRLISNQLLTALDKVK